MYYKYDCYLSNNIILILKYFEVRKMFITNKYFFITVFYIIFPIIIITYDISSFTHTGTPFLLNGLHIILWYTPGS